MKQHPKPVCWRGESLTVAHHSHHDPITFYLLQRETWTCRMNLKWIRIHDLQNPVPSQFLRQAINVPLDHLDHVNSPWASGVAVPPSVRPRRPIAASLVCRGTALAAFRCPG